MNWERVLSVAAALVERRRLTGDELRDVINAVRVGAAPSSLHPTPELVPAANHRDPPARSSAARDQAALMFERLM